MLSHIPKILRFLRLYRSECPTRAHTCFELTLMKLEKKKRSRTGELIRSGVANASHGKPRFIVSEVAGFDERRRRPPYKNVDNGEDGCVYSGLTAVKMKRKNESPRLDFARNRRTRVTVRCQMSIASPA